MKFLLIFLIFFCELAAAQYIPPRTKTSFNKFVEKTSIEWAAYMNDTASFNEYNLGEKLFKRFNSGTSKGVTPVENGLADEDHFTPRTVKDIEFIFVPYRDPVYDANGNETKLDYTEDMARFFKTAVTEFYQILYVQKGRLRSYITRVSPKINIVTRAGTEIGLAEAVSLGINNKFDAEGSKNKLSYLGQTTKAFNPDSIPAYDRLKELYHKNIVDALWPDVLSGKTTVYAASTNEKLMTEKFLSGDYPGAEKLSVPVYDSVGTPLGLKPMFSAVSPASFDKIVVVEKIYFDERKDIFICIIPEVTIFKKILNEEKPSGFRLVF